MALLENERIRLRALEPEDLSLLYEWENNTEWWHVGNTLAPYSRYLLKKYIAESHRDLFETRQVRFMVNLLNTGATVGMVDLYDFDPHHERAGVGVLLEPRYRKNGLATEMVGLLIEYAFTFLKIHQLYVHIPVTNEASKALFLRCGFVITGILTDWVRTENGYHDAWVMQRINDQSSE